MTLPNFLIIGAQKAGTTALYHYLSQHPQIYMSPEKEPGFFAFETEKPDFRGPGDRALYANSVTDLEAYHQLFRGVTNEIAIGEATTWYLYSPEAPERIKHYIPDAKLIAILRNPIERAYSAFMHAIRDERESIADFATALRVEEDRIEQNWEYLWRYKQMGLYASQLKRYFQYFDSHQLKVYLYEDLNTRPAALLTDVFQFLGVEQSYIPEVFTRLNTSGIVKNKTLAALLSDKSTIKRLIKPLIPERWRKELANHLRTQNFLKSELPETVRQQLIEFYRQDVLDLQDLLQRDLSTWLSSRGLV